MILLFCMNMHQLMKTVTTPGQIVWGIRTSVQFFSLCTIWKFCWDILIQNEGNRIFFQPRAGNESLHDDSKDNGVRVVNFATSNNLDVKTTKFPCWNIHKFSRTSRDGKTQSDWSCSYRWHSSLPDVRSFKETDSDPDQYLMVVKFRERLSVCK